MKFIFKTIKRLLWLIFFILVVLIFAAYYLLATDSGYQQIPKIINKFTAYEITYDDLQGNLLSEQSWKNLHISGPDLALKIDDLQLNIVASDLWQRTLRIEKLFLKEGRIDLMASNEETPPSELMTSLPNLDLPIDIVIDDVQVQNFSVNQDQQNIITINSTDLQASLIKGELLAKTTTDLAQLSGENSTIYKGNIDLKGALIGDYPLVLNADVSLDLPDLASEQLKLKLSGSAIKPDLQLNAQGWLNADMHLNGALDLAEKKLAANLSWQNLSYENLVESEKGQINVAGVFDDLKIDLNLQAKGADIPFSTLTGQLQLAGDHILVDQLSLDSDAGKANITGNFSFADSLSWNAQGDIDGFDIGKFANEFPGMINTQFETSGRLFDDVLQVKLDIPTLTGNWQKQALDGKMQIELNGEDINIQYLDLKLGANKVFAQGGLHNQIMDFNFDIDASNLKVFYPALKGSLHGKGLIKGAIASPDIEAVIQGRQIAFEDITLKKLDINLDTIFDQLGEFNNTIVLSELALDKENRWSSIALNTKGNIHQHQISLLTQGGIYNAQLEAQGALSDSQDWQGMINQLKLTGNQIDLKLKNKVAALFSPEKIKLDNFCLIDQYSDLCLSVDKEKETKIAYQIGKFDFKTVQAFIPEIIKTNSSLKGSGDFTITADNKVIGKANIDIQPGQLILQAEGQPPVNFQIDRSNINANLDGQTGKVGVNLSLDKDSYIRANAVINNLSQKPTIQGGFSLLISDIGKFKNFVPELSELKGKLSGDMTVKGALDNPNLEGQIALNEGEVIIPQYATVLNDIKILLTTDVGEKINIIGNIGTPQGALKARGQLDLAPLSLQMNLKGENMQIANSKEIKVTVNPDFDVRLLPEQGLVVRGVIVVPNASIAIPDMESAQQPSSDVIIVNNLDEKVKDTTVQSEIPLDIEIKIQLGDKVYFKNADASIKLIGGITITMLTNQPLSAQGRVEVASGVYELYGQELDINKGWITFSGDITRPILDILAMREVGNVKAGAQVTGTPDNLHLALISDPSMPDASILSYLLFGTAPDSDGSSAALLQAAASVGLNGVVPTNLAEKTGLDVLDIGVNGLKAGKYIFTNLYLGMKTDFFENVSTLLARYQMTKRFSVQGSATTRGSTVDAVYQFETN